MCSQTSYEMLLERMKNVLTSLSRPLVYLHGNYQPEMVGSIVENSLRQFSTSTSSPEKGSIRSRLLPKPNNHIVRLEPFNPEDPNNACVMFFQVQCDTVQYEVYFSMNLNVFVIIGGGECSFSFSTSVGAPKTFSRTCFQLFTNAKATWIYRVFESIKLWKVS